MQVRGTLKRIFTPVYKQPGNFTQKFQRAQSFFRDRRSAVAESLIWPIAFYSVMHQCSLVMGMYALGRILTLGKGDSRNWRKPMYAVLVANGAVPLAPLSLPLWCKSELLMPLTQAFLEHNQKSDLLLPAPEHIAIFGGIPLLLGVSRYLYTLAASGKVIQDLAQSALQEETSAVSSQFSSARKRIDQRTVYKTMKKIRAKDEPAFKTILAHMQAGNSCASRLIDRLNRLSGGQHG